MAFYSKYFSICAVIRVLKVCGYGTSKRKSKTAAAEQMLMTLEDADIVGVNEISK